MDTAASQPPILIPNSKVDKRKWRSDGQLLKKKRVAQIQFTSFTMEDTIHNLLYSSRLQGVNRARHLHE